VGDVYRDDKEAALVAASRLREENKKLKTQLDDLQRMARTAGDPIAITPTTDEGPGWLRISLSGAVAVVLVLLGLALWIGRATARGSSASPVDADHVVMNQPSQPPVFDVPLSAGDTIDRNQVAAALGKVAAELSICVVSGGPSGTGHVKITFEHDGTVSNADVDQPPFAGTAVGDCVARKFRQTQIPSFLGGPVKVGKYFSLGVGRPATDRRF
jgi:hypothetical protein